MITVQPGFEDVIREAIATEAPPTDEQKAALAAELTSDPTGRGYAGATPADALRLLCQPYTVENPEPQGRVPRAVLGRELKLFLGTLLDRLELSDAPKQLKDEWRMRSAARNPLIVDDAPASPEALQAWGVALLTDGLTTPEELAAISSEPDPSYEPFTHYPARIRTIWGEGSMPTLADIAEVLG